MITETIATIAMIATPVRRAVSARPLRTIEREREIYDL
jgi:hypothetical protein